ANTVYISIQGNLDSTTVVPIQQKCKSYLQKGIKNIILDLSGVNFVNSTGFGFLIHFSDTMNINNGYLMIVNVPEKLINLMETTGVTSFFKIYPSQIDAISAIKEKTDIYKVVRVPSANTESSSEADQKLHSLPASSSDEIESFCKICDTAIFAQILSETTCRICKFQLHINKDATTSIFNEVLELALTTNLQPKVLKSLDKFASTYFQSKTGNNLIQILEIIRHFSYFDDIDKQVTIEFYNKNGLLSIIILDRGKPISENVFSKLVSKFDDFKLIKRGRGGNCIILSIKG
ncbi:MAG: STAS domain-containing protein, partial [Planctomycetes bacterium]|nr:STAS domain-containing protein [Planctomycetota bacterium]